MLHPNRTGDLCAIIEERRPGYGSNGFRIFFETHVRIICIWCNLINSIFVTKAKSKTLTLCPYAAMKGGGGHQIDFMSPPKVFCMSYTHFRLLTTTYTSFRACEDLSLVSDGGNYPNLCFICLFSSRDVVPSMPDTLMPKFALCFRVWSTRFCYESACFLKIQFVRKFQ
jgi:hypothetical protein